MNTKVRSTRAHQDPDGGGGPRQDDDRYGNPIVTNRVSMNLVLDKAYLPAETQNEMILQLMGLLEQSGEQSVDKPVSRGSPMPSRAPMRRSPP